MPLISLALAMWSPAAALHTRPSEVMYAETTSDASCRGDVSSLLRYAAPMMSSRFLSSLATHHGAKALANTTAAVRASSVCPVDGLSDFALWHLLLTKRLPEDCSAQLPACIASTVLPNGLTIGECGGGCCYGCGPRWSIVRAYAPVYVSSPYDEGLIGWIETHANDERLSATQHPMGMGFLGATEFFPHESIFTPRLDGSWYADSLRSCADWRETPVEATANMWSTDFPYMNHGASTFASRRGFGGVCGDGTALEWAKTYRRLISIPGPGFKIVLVEENESGPDKDWTGGSIWVESFATEAEGQQWNADYLRYKQNHAVRFKTMVGL